MHDIHKIMEKNMTGPKRGKSFATQVAIIFLICTAFILFVMLRMSTGHHHY
jgi:hypothetical protein